MRTTSDAFASAAGMNTASIPEPDPDEAERALWAILAGRVAMWPRETEVARMLGLSPVYVRRCYAEAWRRRAPSLPRADLKVRPLPEGATGEDALLVYLRTTPVDEWLKSGPLAIRFDVSETLVQHRKRAVQKEVIGNTADQRRVQ